MPQQIFAEVPFEQYRKSTRRKRFFDDEPCRAWAELVAVIESVYLKAEGCQQRCSAAGQRPHLLSAFATSLMSITRRTPMSTNQTGIDLANVRIIQNWPHGSLPRPWWRASDPFAFTDGTQSGQLKFNPKYIDTCNSIGTPQLFLRAVVMPATLTNLDMRIEVGADGAITISEKCSES